MIRYLYKSAMLFRFIAEVFAKYFSELYDNAEKTP